MDKNEIILKIKFIEMALQQNEKLSLLCRPAYDGQGGYRGLELFLISENMTENAIIGNNNYHVVLNHNSIKQKQNDIKTYRNSFCRCLEIEEKTGQDIFEMECTCNKPSVEEAEEHWYNELIEKLEKRSKQIKEIIGEK